MKHNELLEALEKFLKDYKIRISDEFVHQDSKELILHFIRDTIASAVEAREREIAKGVYKLKEDITKSDRFKAYDDTEMEIHGALNNVIAIINPSKE